MQKTKEQRQKNKDKRTKTKEQRQKTKDRQKTTDKIISCFISHQVFEIFHGSKPLTDSGGYILLTLTTLLIKNTFK